MNVENILKVADAIEQHSIPDLGFNMSDWVDRNAEPGQDKSGHNCGTCACIGGWTERLFDLGFYSGDASVILGIDNGTADLLFFPKQNVVASYDVYDATPVQAATVLRHLAATGEVDWNVAAPSAA